MIDVQLVAAGVKTGSGIGEAFELINSQNRVTLISLTVHRTQEQQALEVVLEWSPDGTSWGRMAVMPQQFYEGTTEIALNLRKLPEVFSVRARWELERWGRGRTEVSCNFSVHMMDIPVHAEQAPE